MRRAPSALLVLAVALAAIAVGAALAGSRGNEAGEDVEALFRQGNAAYEKGEYAGAVLLYRRILVAGEESPAVHYNLGNAYLKLGELGEALASYRRAERLSPRDERIRGNLEIARERRADLAPAEGLSPLGALHQAIAQRFSLRELALAADALWYAAALVIVLLLTGKGGHGSRQVLAVVGPLALGALILFGAEYGLRRASAEAVVAVPETEARSGPGPEYTAEFALHEGTEVVIVEEREGWCVVRVGGHLRGWVEEKCLEWIEERPGAIGRRSEGGLNRAAA